MKTPHIIIKALQWVLFILVALLLNLPIIITLLTSFKTDAAINASPPVWLFQPTLAHYKAVLGDPTLHFSLYLFNSTVIAGGGVILSMVLAVPAAYGIVRAGVGASTILPLMANLRAIPLIVFTIPIYIMYQIVGLLDTQLGLMLIACLINLPVTLLMTVGALRALPIEIEEAARVDGANTMQILISLIVPLTRPMLISAGILGFITAWNEFLFGLILSTRSAVPVTVAATYFTTSFGVRWGDTAAAMTLGMLPPMLLGIFAARSIAGAVTVGAVKG
jgi:multiple sugar transport system permease protein